MEALDIFIVYASGLLRVNTLAISSHLNHYQFAMHKEGVEEDLFYSTVSVANMWKTSVKRRKERKGEREKERGETIICLSSPHNFPSTLVHLESLDGGLWPLMRAGGHSIWRDWSRVYFVRGLTWTMKCHVPYPSFIKDSFHCVDMLDLLQTLY